MSYGTITVGWLTLRETSQIQVKINASTGVKSISLAGQESFYPLTLAQARQREEDINGLYSRYVQITFTDKSDHNGFYQVTDSSATQVNNQGEAVTVDWSISADLIGPGNSVDIDSRLTAIVRQNDFALTGEVTHSPAIGHYSYYTGTTQPSTMTRTSADGAITVYRNVPAVSPRWGVNETQYLSGGVRVNISSIDRTGTNITVAGSSSWSLYNGLINVTPGTTGGLISFKSFSGGAYHSKDWNVSISASASGGFSGANSVTITRNDPEISAVRLEFTGSPGRTLLDISLRRGSRIAECYLQTDRSSTIGVFLQNNEPATSFAASGFMVATSSDGDGNKFTIGSARSFTANTNGGLYKTATTKMDFYVGAVIAGTGAVSGDAATDLRNQYIAAPAETTAFVRR